MPGTLQLISPPFLTKQMRPNGKGGLGLQITKGITIAYGRRPTHDMTHSNHGSLLSQTVSEINGNDGQKKRKVFLPLCIQRPR